MSQLTAIKLKIEQMISMGLYEEARICLEDYHKLCQTDVDYYSMSGCLYMAEGKLVDAEESFTEGIALDSANFDLLYNLCYLKRQMGNDAEALTYYYELKLRNYETPFGYEELIANSRDKASNELRVVHGTMEIANQMRALTNGIAAKGHYAKTLCYYPNYLKYHADYSFDIRQYADPVEQSKRIAAEILSEFDIFHFHYGMTLTLDQSDLPVLKDIGKKVVMHHWGSDVRLLSKALEVNPYIKVKSTDEEAIKRNLEHLSRYIDHGIIADRELYLFVKDYYKNIHFIPQAINLEEYPYMPSSKKKKLLLVHAPTSPEIKGSQYIINAVEKLRPHYNIEFKLIQGMSHEEAKQWYQQADLIVDEILCGAYGLLAIECMSMGKPVISWIPDYMKEHYPAELPLLSANPDTISQVIKNALDNRDALPEIGRRGRAYVEKYHDVNRVSEQLIALYRSL